jgi:hypothetical protein
MLTIDCIFTASFSVYSLNIPTYTTVPLENPEKPFIPQRPVKKYGLLHGKQIKDTLKDKVSFMQYPY